MKDIGHYAGFLSQEEQEEIRQASLLQLYDLGSDILLDLHSSEDTEFEADPSLRVNWGRLNSRESISLIRGLCDAIEVKLMEVAE